MEYRRDLIIEEGWESILAEETLETVCEYQGWEKVQIPHNWDQYHGYHRVSHGNLHGTAWYRRTLQYQETWKGKRVYLLFEGVGSYADVWLNGSHVASHSGGRTCFQADLTDYLKEDDENFLYVRAHHPEKIRDLPWVCGGCFGTPNSEGSQPLGIFRPVHIQVTGEVRVKPFGVYLTTPNLEGNRSDVKIESELVNESDRRQSVILKQELLDRNETILRELEETVELEPYEERCQQQRMEKITSVLRWYPEQPVLYKIRTSIRKSQEQLDIVENSFGFRELVWENFDGSRQWIIDQTKLEEIPGTENRNFVTYTRGSENSLVAIVPGGVKVFVREFQPERVVISIDTVIRNQDKADHQVQLESFVQTYNRTKVIANLITPFVLKAGEERIITQVCDPLSFPDLWSRENPFLHNVISTIRGMNEDLKEYCQTSTSFRICDCSGLANKGNALMEKAEDGKGIFRRLLINGKPYFLNGSCEYEHELGNDHAFTEEMIETRMKMFQAAGFNAFREAHCPHNLRYLEFCDRRGILYWAQMGAHIYFDTEEFRKNFLKLTEEWLRERRNSPSIILWGVQNESMLPTEFAGRVTELIHKLDETAPDQRKAVTCNGGTGSDWNIPQNWSGTYGGTVENYAKEAVSMRLIGEYGQYRVKGRHQEGSMERLQNSGGEVPEELFAYSLETKVREAEKVRDYFYGHFQWIFTTHANPGRELLYCLDGKGTNRIGVVNNKGIFTCWGEPTDVYYMYRANYVSPKEEAMVYIVSHSWPDRFKEPTLADITVYSNCDEVELYNDFGEKSLGRKKRGRKGEAFLFEKVWIKEGVLTAKGYVDQICMAQDEVLFPELPLPKRKKIIDEMVKASSEDLYRVNCGGEDYLDQQGFLWKKDQRCRNGEWGCHTWGMDFDNVEDEIGSFAEIYDEIADTKEQGLFQKFRYGRNQLYYDFPVENGVYEIELYFMEPWYGTAGENAEGWRVFDVAVNREIVCRKLDIFKETGGERRVLKKQVEAEINQKSIRISFPHIYSNQAVISAIRIRRVKRF